MVTKIVLPGDAYVFPPDKGGRLGDGKKYPS